MPFDPVSASPFLSWQIVNAWSRAEALGNQEKLRYRDYAGSFGYLTGDVRHWGAIRDFLTTIGSHSQAHGETVSCVLDKRHAVEVAMQLLNHLPTGSVALLRAALLVPVHSWQAVLLGPEGMTHDAASRTLAIRSTVMLDELHQPYVTIAQAKSLSELLVVLRYRLRLAISPIISGVNRSLAWLFSGGLLVEIVLSLSTAGPTLTTALFVQDMYPAGIYVLIAGALTSTGSLLSDLTLAVLDPRHPVPPSGRSSSRDDEEHAEEMPEAKD